SNLLSKVNATDFRILFGQKRAISFASQFVKTETLRSTETFADLVRGLKVWGVKVTKPEAMGVIIGKRG
ncbi:MAG: hypothetical protein RLZZ524_2299, partial [Pseudomonadota bacterium]